MTTRKTKKVHPPREVWITWLPRTGEAHLAELDKRGARHFAKIFGGHVAGPYVLVLPDATKPEIMRCAERGCGILTHRKSGLCAIHAPMAKRKAAKQ